VSVVDDVYEPCACTPIGKLKKTSRPYAPGGTVYWTVHNYDSLGRTVSTVAPDGVSTTTFEYQGNTLKVMDPQGKWKKHEQDAFGNLVKVVEPNPGGGADFETTYTYNRFNQLFDGVDAARRDDADPDVHVISERQALDADGTGNRNDDVCVQQLWDARVEVGRQGAGDRVHVRYDLSPPDED
jgi:hypothetical protein